MYFQRLRDLREDADLSQKQVAALLGIQDVYKRQLPTLVTSTWKSWAICITDLSPLTSLT